MKAAGYKANDVSIALKLCEFAKGATESALKSAKYGKGEVEMAIAYAGF